MITVKGTNLHQWETKREIELTCINIDELHWSKPSMSQALRIKAEDDNFTFIPDILLQTSEKLIVHAIKNNRVVDIAVFDIKPKKKPSDYIYTPIEIQTLDKITKRVIDLEKDSPNNVKATESQSFTEQEKSQARQNINAQEAGEYVTEQSFGDFKDNDLVDMIPTKLSELENDSEFVTETYVKEAIADNGTTNYEELENLPSINGVELKGKLPLNALGVAGRNDVEAAFNSLYNDALPKGYVAKGSIIDELDNALGEVTEHEALDIVTTFYQVLANAEDVEGVKSQISEAQESVDSVKYDYVSQARLFNYSNSSENLLNEGGYEDYGYRWEQNNNNELVFVDDIKYSMLHDIPLPDGTKKIYVYNSNIKTDIGDEFSIFFTPSTYKVLGSAKLTGNYNGAEIDVPDGATRFHVDIKNTYLNPFSTVKVCTAPIDTIKERYLPNNVATISYVDEIISSLQGDIDEATELIDETLELIGGEE